MAVWVLSVPQCGATEQTFQEVTVHTVHPLAGQASRRVPQERITRKPLGLCGHGLIACVLLELPGFRCKGQTPGMHSPTAHLTAHLLLGERPRLGGERLRGRALLPALACLRISACRRMNSSLPMGAFPAGPAALAAGGLAAAAVSRSAGCMRGLRMPGRGSLGRAAVGGRRRGRGGSENIGRSPASCGSGGGAKGCGRARGGRGSTGGLLMLAWGGGRVSRGDRAWLGDLGACAGDLGWLGAGDRARGWLPAAGRGSGLVGAGAGAGARKGAISAANWSSLGAMVPMVPSASSREPSSTGRILEVGIPVGR